MSVSVFSCLSLYRWDIIWMIIIWPQIEDFFFFYEICLCKTLYDI